MSRVETDDVGTQRWYDDQGCLHRDDGPAIEHADGSKFWYHRGVLHRDDDPAIEYSSGSKVWYKNGLTHRIDGPAVEFKNGGKEWFKYGKLYRIDGPAIIHTDSRYSKWYIWDISYEKSKLDMYVLRIQCLFWRAWRRRRITKQSCLDELLVHPPSGVFPGGAMYQESVSHFESYKI